MAESYFPLRWESTGDQWWYASPIDLAAANGHYDLVRELLYLDTNFLIKLTSLCRIRRLETVWDDEEQFQDVSKNRSQVAHKLFLECENKKGLNNNNSLIRAGYGGWLLYTAASAGDIDFVKRLLERDPLLVFGEGDYGVTDILYGAARSKNYDVFRLILDSAISGKCNLDEIDPVFKWDMMNRAVHAAARGGDVKILKEILGNCDDVLVYRDAQGSTLLHSASGRGQVEVVNFLLDSYDVINALDQQGNTALHIAAYRGYSSVLQILIGASPSTALLRNNFGDTFLHMAVAGFRSPGFRRLDRLVDLVKNLVNNGEIVVMEDIINAMNNDGRTALHLAVIDNVQSELVELLLSAPSIDLNARDLDGNTPLDLLRRRPKSASSEILIKEMISAGGISNCQDYITRSALVSQMKMQVIGNSPGTSFRIPDGEIFLYTGIKGRYDGYASTDYDNFSGEISYCGSSIGSEKQKGGRLSSVSRRLKMLLRFASRKEKEEKTEDFEDRITPYKSVGKTPISLRQRFSNNNNKRVLDLDIPDYPTPDDKRRFGAGLMQGVMRVKRQLYFGSPSSTLSESSMSSPKSLDNKDKGGGFNNNNNTGIFGSILSPNKSNRMKSLNRDHGSWLINQYLCIGAQGLACGDDPNTIVASQVAKTPPVS